MKTALYKAMTVCFKQILILSPHSPWSHLTLLLRTEIKFRVWCVLGGGCFHVARCLFDRGMVDKCPPPPPPPREDGLFAHTQQFSTYSRNNRKLLLEKIIIAYLNNWKKRRVQRAIYNAVICHSNKDINVISMACMQWLNSTNSTQTTVQLKKGI